MWLHGGEVSVNNGTALSAALKLSRYESTTMGMTVRRTAGTAAFDIVLQGAWTDSSDNSEWADTTLLASGIDTDSPIRVGGIDEMVWAVYRVKLVSAGEVSVAFRVAEVDVP